MERLHSQTIRTFSCPTSTVVQPNGRQSQQHGMHAAMDAVSVVLQMHSDSVLPPSAA